MIVARANFVSVYEATYRRCVFRLVAGFNRLSPSRWLVVVVAVAVVAAVVVVRVVVVAVAVVAAAVVVRVVAVAAGVVAAVVVVRVVAVGSPMPTTAGRGGWGNAMV
jgi:hypothetical protein